MRSFFFCCLAITWGMLVVPVRAHERVVLQLKWLHAYQFAGYYVAGEKGYYRAAGLDVESREEGPNRLNFVYGTGSASLLLDRYHGAPVVILGVIFQHSPDVLIVAQNSDITTPQQLVNRTVMDSVSTPSLKPMPLREVGSLDKFNFLDMNPGRWKHITDTYILLGQLGPDYSLEGFLYDPESESTIAKLKRILGATLVMFLAAGAAILLLWSFNRRLNKQKQITQAFNERLQAQLAENLALQAKLRDEAIRDPLTGLFNRRYLEETLERELSRAGREQSSLSLAMLDIDHFKRLNDTHGHAAGDVILRSLSTLLRDYTRTEDVVCRYGGEEFVVVFPATSLPHAMQRMEQLRAAIESLRVSYERMVLQNTISIGIAAFPVHGKTSRQLLQAADMALYEAKESGRNRVMACESAPNGAGA